MGITSIALIDDQPLFVEAFTSLCSASNDIRLVASATSANAAPQLLAQFKPDILFIDVSGADSSPDAIKRLCAQSSQVKIVGLTGVRSIALAIQTLEAGAFGYVLKQSSRSELYMALRALAQGERFITNGFASKIVTALQDSTLRKKAADALKLTIRENQILRLILDGKTNREIATALTLSEKTVKHYMTLLMQKLNVRNRLEVAIAAKTIEQSRASAEFH